MSVQVSFHNLEKSDLVADLAAERVSHTLEKFPGLTESAAAKVIVGSEKSAHFQGKDLFKVKVMVPRHRKRPVIIEKVSANFYQALADVTHGLLEVLHRVQHKQRETLRSRRREAKLAKVRRNPSPDWFVAS